ncbi:MAG: hypothetical protein ACJAWW_002015 [Sulfurimonas sp.]|jgi:hypothetical protein
MKKIVHIYIKDKTHIQNYLQGIVKSMPKNRIENIQAIFKKYKYIQLAYTVNSDFIQTTESIYRKKIVEGNINKDKSHYFRNINIDDDGVFVSNPYLDHTTGRPSISVVHRSGDEYYVFDVNLLLLLEDLQLIEYNSFYERFTKFAYIIGSALLSLIALSLIGYGAYVLGALMFSLSTSDFLHDVFKSIVAITIGLAMFDLSKQIMEHEVLFKSFHKEEDKEFKVLGKFLISIIIALSIETLMIVFKIVLEDYTQMLSAFYLLLGTTIMFVGLAYYHKTIKSGLREDF